MTVYPSAQSQNNDLLRQGLVVVGTVVTLIVNGLANALPLNGQTTAAVSDSFPVYFVPAGYVFAIWSVIYLALIGYTIYQALPGQRTNPAQRRIGWLYILSCAANSIWIFFWHYELFPLTVLAMLTVLGSLLVIYVRLAQRPTPISTAERWLLHVPFSIYLGWITVATIANVTDLLYYLGWRDTGTGGQLWAVALLAVGTLIAAFIAYTRRDVAYLLVLVWAFIGIMVSQADTPLVAGAAAVAAALVALALVGSQFLIRRPRPRMAARTT
jgi:hypothetical protein